MQKGAKSIEDPDPEALKRQAAKQPAAPKRSYQQTDDERGLMMNCIMAAIAYMLNAYGIAAQLVITLAVIFFKHRHPDSSVTRHRYLAKDVYARMASNLDLRNLPRGAKVSCLNDALLDEMIAAFKGGFHDGSGRFWGFTSPVHAANKPGRFQQLLQGTGLTVKYVWSRMQARHIDTHGRGMKKISIHIKPMLKAETKMLRLEISRQWLEWGMKWLMNCVWIDEKQEYITPGGTYRCYAPDDVTSFGRADTNDFAKKTKVKWIIAVSARLGCPYFNLVTGTTGMKSEYVVRTCVPAGADPQTACGLALPESCINDGELVC